ncbi:MAG: FAD-linked oxidase [Chloroflexi bacterium RBG_19FT_COMBO_55_16]|nr:MAG: FAD-linked oxidase [Chloroflexi bacterium RBG_19FT_COMBO_55_16]
MKRWNGWGEEEITYPLPPSAARYLEAIVGTGVPSQDIPRENVLDNIPASRLLSHPLVSIDKEDRLRHARGQSLPDWVALRSGQIGVFPDGVAYPRTEQEVHTILNYARSNRMRVIPYGGGTSVVGHINPPAGEVPCLTMDLSNLNRLVYLDETSRLATFEAGVRGPSLEAQLQARGYTLGHFPQSFEFSTLGGWIATRSCGQQSYYYGRIEDLFAGGHLEMPDTHLDISVFPASAAGPDLRELILGSEGRFGVLTRATIRIRPLPEAEAFFAVFFHDMESGLNAIKEIVQADLPISMVRLSDAIETETTLALAGKPDMVSWGGRLLTRLGFGSGRCLLLFGVTGKKRTIHRLRNNTHTIARSHGGLPVGKLIGEQWRKSRFLTPYLRNTLWEQGYALDTLETAVAWCSISETASRIKEAIVAASAPLGKEVLVFSHISSIYRDGASIYVTYLFSRQADPEETLHRWQVMKSAASHAIIAQGGTISHQHGVGRDHLPYLESEKGRLGMAILESIGKTCDPSGMLNPGALFASDQRQMTKDGI